MEVVAGGNVSEGVEEVVGELESVDEGNEASLASVIAVEVEGGVGSGGVFGAVDVDAVGGGLHGFRR